MNDTDDKQLLAMVTEGDQQAFRQLMQRHIQAISSYGLQILKDKALAEEVAQETFLRVWQKAVYWKDQGFSVKSWIYKICYNLCIDTIRRLDKQSEYQQREFLKNDFSGEISPEQFLEYEQTVKALTELPERQYHALLLNVFQGLNNSEAAEVLEISVEAVESLLARARRKLKEILVEQG